MTQSDEANEFLPKPLAPRSKEGLPVFFDEVNISEWAEINPEDLVKRHKEVVGAGDLPFLSSSSAARAIKYGRSAPSLSYDLIALRTLAACPARGPGHVLTLSGMIASKRNAKGEPDRTSTPGSSHGEGYGALPKILRIVPVHSGVDCVVHKGSARTRTFTNASASAALATVFSRPSLRRRISSGAARGGSSWRSSFRLPGPLGPCT